MDKTLKLETLICACLLSFAGSALAATIADPHFTDSVFVADASKLGNEPSSTDGQVNGITCMEWAPDGANRLYVTVKGRSKKNALIQVIRDGVIQSVPFYNFSTGLETHNECGLMSLVFHPDYSAGTKQLYCFITVSNHEQQILRFNETVDPNGNFVASGPPTPVVTGIPTNGEIHNGGALAIAPDQHGHGHFLYWTCGNNGIDRGHRLTTDSLGSKIGRANLDGSIPTDGLNATGYIWSFGYRNPFTMAVQPDTGKLWVNVVGELYEQIYVPSAGSWAGDKDFEGNAVPKDPALRAKQCFPIVKYRTGSVDKRLLTASNGVVRQGNIVTFTTTAPHRLCKGEQITLSGVSPASFNGVMYVLATSSDKIFTAEWPGQDLLGSGGLVSTQSIGNCITGGAFNDKSTWPQEYRGNFFFGDFGSGRITRVQMNPDNSVKQVDSFLTGGRQIIDVSFGPDGQMYYAIIDAGAIHKVTYTALIVTTDSHLRGTTVGAAYSQKLSATGNKGPAAWSVASGNLPVGVTLDAGTGTIAGTPGAAGSFKFKIRVADGPTATGSKDFMLVVNPAPQMAGATLTKGSLGVEYHQILASTGGTAPRTWSLTDGTLPGGLALNPATGVIGGIPSAAGASSFSVTFKDAANVSDHGDFSIVIEARDSAPAITSIPITHANLGAAYVYTVKANGFPRPTYSLTTAPPGMTIEASNGEIRWAPTAVGNYDVAVKAANRIQPDSTQKFALAVESYGLAARPSAKPYLGLNPAALPATLGATGIFLDHQALKPAPALIPYTVNSPFWSDRAAKTRWISIPTAGASNSAGEQVGFSPTGEWTFPAGTVLVKHFELVTDERNPALKKRLETRVLFVQDEGTVFGATYKWRPDGTNADLLPDGADEDFEIATTAGSMRTQRWHYPSRSECLQCHNSAAGGVLGLKTRQLNGNLTYAATGVTDNQLRSWNHIRLFKTALNEGAIAAMPKLVSVTNSRASLEQRVRSYLDANCSNCHRPGGAPAVFDARFDTPLDNQNIVAGNVNKDLGVKGAKLVLGHNLERSILHLRLKTTDPTVSMPPLARNAIDTDALRAIETWINTLPETGSGLSAEYFANPDLADLKETRIDETVNFDFQQGLPESLAPDSFSVRWTGEVQAPLTETYTFSTITDDGARLWINGQLLVDKWVKQGPTEWSGTIALKAGEKYPLKMEYFQRGGGASAKLMWSSPSTPKSIVPRSVLYADIKH